MSRKLVMWNNLDDPCQNHRLLLPARFVGGEDEFQGRVTCGSDAIVEPGDVYMQHGMILPSPDRITKLSEAIHKGAKFAWAIDDDYLNIPDWNMNRLPASSSWVVSLADRSSDFAVVSTPHLATKLQTKGRVLVAPNLMDLSAYPCELGHPQKYKRRDGEDKVRIVWSGSHTHSKDVKVMEKGLDHVLSKYQGKLDVIFFGSNPSDELNRKWLRKGLFLEPGVPPAVYPGAICSIAPHVVLAPLHECEFNRSKSNIRVLESWVLSAAVVASDFGEYACVSHGVDGLKCKTEDDWADALDALIADSILRIRLGNAGRRRVESEYNWLNPECRGPWRVAFREMLAD